METGSMIPASGTSEPELIKAFVADRDVPCPACGYNLRGGQSMACAECGARLDLRVGCADFKLSFWIFSLLAIALPLGYAAATGAMLVVTVLEFGRAAIGGNDWPLFISHWMAPLVYAPVLWWLVRKRRRFWTRPSLVQLRMSIAIGACSAVILATLLYCMARTS
jgi:hypothetical protein